MCQIYPNKNSTTTTTPYKRACSPFHQLVSKHRTAITTFTGDPDSVVDAMLKMMAKRHLDGIVVSQSLKVSFCRNLTNDLNSHPRSHVRDFQSIQSCHLPSLRKSEAHNSHNNRFNIRSHHKQDDLIHDHIFHFKHNVHDAGSR